MLFSILCTYYNKQVFDQYTNKSILEQEYDDLEFIPIDNSDGRFSSAGQAYNDKAFKAKGDYLIFVHQDVKLYSRIWLATLAKLVGSIEFGIAGCSGVSATGQRLGFIKDRKTIWGRPFCVPQKAQTVDESIMIIPKKVFVSMGGFDPSLGWNSYGTDFSLKCLAQELSVLVFPLFLWHDSPSVLRGIEKVLWQIKQRYGQGVHTTSGNTRLNSLIISTLKSYLPPSLKKFLVTFLSAIGKEKEGNLLSFKLRKASKISILDILPEGGQIDRCIIPTKIELERLINNPVWRDQSIDLFIARNKQELKSILRANAPSTVTLAHNDLKPCFMQQNDIQMIPFSANYSLVKVRAD